MTLKRTALYLRLSRDDEKAGESLSIENQRAILKRFAEENGGTIAGEYIDDGWSGTSFERPAVQRLLEDAKNGKIDTILVKDLSRFGRNYIQVGQYVDYIFPAYGIRFIALSDNVDTADRTSSAMDMMPIMNVFNEWHAANTSKKIRAVLECNWRKGKYTNWAYPYGYKAGQDEKRTAVIDEDAAAVVRRIFDLRLQGNSARAIARTLTDEGIPNPTAHYTRLDGQKSERRNLGLWSPKTIADILRDETYIGTLTQHRTARFSYKNHAVCDVPADERFIVTAAHQPIIPYTVWQRVQEINSRTFRGRMDKSGTLHPLSGLLVCADCGKKMKYKRAGAPSQEKEGFYSCRTYTDLGKKYCSSHTISKQEIVRLVLKDLRSMLGNRQIDEQKTREHFLSSRAKQKEKESAADGTELRALKKRLFELDKLIASTFEEKVLGSLPENVCKDLCEKFFSEKESASRRISDLEKSLQQDSAEEEAEKYLLRLKQYANCEDLTREMCLLLIDKIVVGEKSTDGTPRKIDIYYKFSAPKQSP